MKFVTSNSATGALGDSKDIEGGVVDYLRDLGINRVGWRDQFFVRPPDANERAFFNLSERVQVAMLDVRRTGYDEEGNPIRVTVTVTPATATSSRWKPAKSAAQPAVGSLIIVERADRRRGESNKVNRNGRPVVTSTTRFGGSQSNCILGRSGITNFRLF